jgi:caffeoyl-CoA O-methyltransferase
MSKIILSTQSEYISSFRKKTDSLVEEMEAYAQEHNVPILSWESAEFLEQLILTKIPEVLELGTAIAYSTIRIARNLRESGYSYN